MFFAAANSHVFNFTKQLLIKRAFSFRNKIYSLVIFKDDCPIWNVIAKGGWHFKSPRKFEEEFDAVICFAFRGKRTLYRITVYLDVVVESLVAFCDFKEVREVCFDFLRL